jgi:ankyrin repeat protein
METNSVSEARMLPIHWAASDGKIHAIKYYVDHRLDINAQDANGCTPVMIATQYNQIPTVIYLLKSGADITLKDNNGDCALHWAAYKGHEELCGVLLHFAPRDLELADTFGQTPLHLAALRGNHEAVEYLISDHGANCNVKDKDGATALDLSIKKKQLKTEWVIRSLTTRNTLDLVLKLGMQKLRDFR